MNESEIVQCFILKRLNAHAPCTLRFSKRTISPFLSLQKIIQVLKKHLKKDIDRRRLFGSAAVQRILGEQQLSEEFSHVVWTDPMRRFVEKTRPIKRSVAATAVCPVCESSVETCQSVLVNLSISSWTPNSYLKIKLHFLSARII